MSITTIEKKIGFRLESLSINADKTLLAIFTVGTVGEAGEYRAIASKDYYLPSVEAYPILNEHPSENGSLIEQITTALVKRLSTRTDWIG